MTTSTQPSNALDVDGEGTDHPDDGEVRVDSTTPHSDPAENVTDLSLPRLMTLGISTRLLVDTTSQIFNPFLPIFAAGLGVSVVTMGQLLSLRSIMGLLAPWIGALADQRGYRLVMRWSLVLLIGGLLLVGGSAALPMAVAGIVMMGIGLAGFVPTLHAYMSARLPYQQRARGLGMLEYSWALAGIVGLYSVGRIIAWSTWRVPLFVLAGGLAIMWLLLGILPAAKPYHATAHSIRAAQMRRDLPWLARLANFFHVGANARSAYSTIGAQTLLFFAGMQLFIVYGAWLSREYGLGAVELGTVALILGCADLSASVSVSLFTDRIGKLRSVIMGTAVMLFGNLLMPLLNVNVVGAVAGIILTRTAFEFGIVSEISLISEQAPDHRAKLMSLSAAFTLLGGTVANLTGPWLYEKRGVWAISWSSILALTIALVLLFTQVRERP